MDTNTGKILVSQSDNLPNFAWSKLQAGNGIALRNNGNSIRIDAIGTNVVGTIQDVVKAGDRITTTTTSNYVIISADVQDGDHKSLASASDTTPNYLDSKILGSGVVSVTNNTSSLYIAVDPSSTDGQVLTTDNGAVAWKTPTTQTGDHKVIVNSSDTNPQYLGTKLKAGANINIGYYNNDKMEISGLGQVRINASGASGYLTDKLLQGSGITLTKTNNDITIAADTQAGDHKTIIDSNDTSPGYLSSKLTAGTGITLTNNGSDIEISATGGGGGMTNPMTTAGDMIIGGASGTPDRLGIGSNDQILTVYSGNPKWRNLVNGSGITLDSTSNYIKISADTQTGDHLVLATTDDATSPGALADKLYVFSPLVQSTATAGGVKRVTVRINAGVDGTVLTSNSGSISWEAPATQTGDHKIIVDGNDTSPNYLSSKLTAGSNITLTNNGTDLEISATDIGFANPMTTAGDLIVGGSSGVADRLGIGTSGQVLTVSSGTPAWAAIPTQTGDHKVLTDSSDTVQNYLYDKVVTTNGLSKSVYAVGSTRLLSLGIDVSGASENQVLSISSGAPAWVDRPLVTDWCCPPVFMISNWTRKADRTFYVRLYPTTTFSEITALMTMVKNPHNGDEWRGAIYNWQRQMMYYGTISGNTNVTKTIPLTKLSGVTDDFDGQYVHYLAISQHTLGGSNSALMAFDISSDATFVWYEDVALTSGRAMPSSGLSVPKKIPAIGIRGYV